MRSVKIGFIPSHREPFGEEWAVQMRARCIEQLRLVPGLKLVAPNESLTHNGLVRSIEEGERARELFLREQVAGVIVGGMTFGHETSAVGVTIAGMPAGTPVLQFATKGAPIGPEGTRASDSWCGQFMITSALRRRGIRFEHIPTCFPEEPAFREGAARFVRACAATQGFRGARFGQIGTRPEEFESVWWDEASLQRRFNQTVVPIDLVETFARIEAVDAEAVETTDVLADISKGADTSLIPGEYLMGLAKIEVALRHLAREKRLVGMGVNCWQQVQKRFGTCVCSVLGRLTDSGLMASCEVDIYGAATMWAAYLASLGEVAPHFIDWTELHPDRDDVFLAWHCGNAPRSLCCAACQPRFLQHSILPLQPSWGTLEMRLRPGPVTCARLAEYEGKFSMFIGQGEILDIGPETRGAYAWVQVADVYDWERKMVENGIIHHGVLIHDPEVGPALASFCHFMDIEVIGGK